MDRIRTTTYGYYDNDIQRLIREVKLTFEDDDRICNLSYEFDVSKFSPYEYVQVKETVRQIFTILVMNVKKCLNEFKKNIEL